jgi:hypothetical protein
MTTPPVPATVPPSAAPRIAARRQRGGGGRRPKHLKTGRIPGPDDRARRRDEHDDIVEVRTVVDQHNEDAEGNHNESREIVVMTASLLRALSELRPERIGVK